MSLSCFCNTDWIRCRRWCSPATSDDKRPTSFFSDFSLQQSTSASSSQQRCSGEHHFHLLWWQNLQPECLMPSFTLLSAAISKPLFNCASVILHQQRSKTLSSIRSLTAAPAAPFASTMTAAVFLHSPATRNKQTLCLLFFSNQNLITLLRFGPLPICN